MTVREMIERRVKLGEESKAVLEKAKKEGRAVLSGEEQAKFDELHKEISDLRAKIDAEEQAAKQHGERVARQEELERELSQTRGRRTQSAIQPDGAAEPTRQERAAAFRAWCLGKRALPEMLAAADRCGVDALAPFIDMAVVEEAVDGKVVKRFLPVVTKNQDVEARALSVGTTTAGGAAVPNEMMVAYTEAQKWFGRLAALAQLVNTETGSVLPWPTVTDTANTGRVLAEATAATTTTDPTFDVVNLLAHKFSSDAVLVSWELLQDSFIALDAYLGTALGRRIGRVKNTKFTVGAGTTEPAGIITGAGTGVTAASATAFTPDEVIQLVHSLDPAYRGMPGTGFMMHDTIAGTIRQFKDGQGRYLWEMSLQAGQPDRLLGYPVEINNDMASALTTGQKVVLFGNINYGFVVRNAGATRFVRDESIRVQNHQVYFEALERGDSHVVDATALKLLVLA